MEVQLHVFLTSALAGVDGVIVQLHAPAALSLGRSLRYSLDKRLGGPQSRSGRGGEEKKTYHCLCRESNSSGRARSLVCVLTELPRLTYVVLPLKLFYEP
jgi:hypothetical protein